MTVWRPVIVEESTWSGRCIDLDGEVNERVRAKVPRRPPYKDLLHGLV